MRIQRRALALTLLVAVVTPLDPARPGSAASSLEAYRGLGTWVDIFEERAWRNPGRTVAQMASRGVRTIYLQTSNYSQRTSVVYREAVGRFLEAAHDRDMRVVAWYLPGFARLRRDLQRSVAAIAFRSPSGERFDSFALDIEASILDPPSKRSRRLLALSRKIRARVGAEYPLGAIIPSPVGIELAGKRYWPGFPYAGLAELYDVFVPMGYFTYHVRGATKVHDETARNAEIIRERTGRPEIPIHMIGGIGDESSGVEVEAFVRAVREHGLLGASMYNWSLTREEHWTSLSTIPANPVQSPPLPLPLPYAPAIGNVEGEDRTHPKEVVFRTGGLPGSHTLSFEARDIDQGEVELLVNWRPVAPVAPSAAPGWSPRQTVPLPDILLNDRGENVIQLVAAGNHPDWSEWAVRNVELAA